MKPRLIRTMKSVMLRRKDSPEATRRMMNTSVKSHEYFVKLYGNILSSPRDLRCRDAARNAGTKVVRVAMMNAIIINKNHDSPPVIRAIRNAGIELFSIPVPLDWVKRTAME